MFRLISEKRHNKIVGELINDHTDTVQSLVQIGDDLNVQLESCRQKSDDLSKYNGELQRKDDNSKQGNQYGLANHRINLSFYYGSYNSFSCRVTFTPNLCDITSGYSGLQKRFGWGNDGAPIASEIEVMEQMFKEMTFNSWHWSSTEKKPAAWFGNHDIAAITAAVSKFNDVLQQQVNNILTAEQCMRIAKAKEPAKEVLNQ